MNYNPPTYDKKWVDNFVGCKIDAKCEHICCYVQTFYLLQSLGLKPPILAFSHFHFQFVDTLIESFVGTSKSLWWSIQVTVLTSVESTCHVLVLGTFWISHTSLVLVVGPLWNITTSREEHCNLRAPHTVQFPSPSWSRIFHVSSLRQGHERQSGPSVVMQGKALLSVPSALSSRGARHSSAFPYTLVPTWSCSRL
jgi:hypothetical protein